LFGFLKRLGRRQTAREELAESVKQRPIQCATAIDALLDRIAPPIADPEALALRGQALAKLVLSSEAAMQEAGIGSPYPPFEPGTPSATLDEIRRLIDVEREARAAGADANPGAEAPDEPLYAAQVLRWALEGPRRECFSEPDAYSGAKWAKAVGANGRLDYFVAGMVALDSSGDLAKDFVGLYEVLSATGHRLPVTPEEQVSHASLMSLGA